MTKHTAATRIPVRTYVYSAVLKRLISARLKPLTLPLTQRTIAAPTVTMVPTRHGAVRCFIYRPHSDAPLARGGATPPVHVNIHGGGFILTAARQDEHILKYLAAEVGAVIVNVDYSTAPEVLFPVAEEQCFDVLTWVSTHGAEQGWDSTRISIGGGSAGGKLAISALQLAHRAGAPVVRAAELVVPFVDATLAPDSYRSVLAKPVIGPTTISIIERTYFVAATHRSDPLVSPIFDPDLVAAMPPTLVLGAEYDTLRPQTERFVERLQAGHAQVTYRRFDGMDHSFLGVPSTPAAVIEESVHLIGAHLLQHLGRDTTSPGAPDHGARA